ncbi:MAG: hypothetical protein A2Z99_17595 [Treponema sp. GWB1_62_6]|nr:MAG: hypothetical protein A2001_03210 [Treponema sp. GWC1_61_84]OHE70894.1 MAG: hypothetical protein A2Z99_17595 [Treponema sp. GWB1_62_6]OHE75528.1 MAG: hypothetical protein A2413_18285 [Treponema sp. RIFOXYC1_FULL_61_9]
MGPASRKGSGQKHPKGIQISGQAYGEPAGIRSLPKRIASPWVHGYILLVFSSIGKSFARSLRSTMLIVVALVYAVAATGTFVVFVLSARAISYRYASRFASSQSLLEKEKILSLVERELALSLKLADDPAVRAWMLAEDDAALAEAAGAQLESYRRFLRDGAWFVAVRKSGSYYARTPATAAPVRTRMDPAVPGDRWFYDALAKDSDYALNVDHNDLLGENRIWINVLVRDRDGKAIGLAGCGMDLTSFLAALVGHQEPGIATVIVDSAGKIMAHEDAAIVAWNAETDRESEKVNIYGLLGSDADRERLKAFLSSNSFGDGAIGISIGKKRLLCSVGFMDELGWRNLVLVDAATVIGAADLVPLGAAVLVSLLVVLAGVFAAMNGLVLAPLRALTRAAGIIAGGAYDAFLPVTGENEIGLLGVSFNEMTRKVREYATGLEVMVAERTKELNDVNGQVLESLRYAGMIQEAILPAKEDMEGGPSAHFVIRRPRDLVGGDLHFYRTTSDGFWIAVVDCTGHGVPGAFMSMTVNALLDRLCEADGEEDPASLLSRLHVLARATLSGGDTRRHFDNGFDIALCRYRRASRTLEFAGGGLPLYHDAGGRVAELKGDRSPLGYSSVPLDIRWTKRIVEAPAGTTFYLLTDGVLDLPGGQKGFGLGRSRFVELVDRAKGMDMEGQARFFAAQLDSYRGGRAQRDDVTLVGFRV